MHHQLRHFKEQIIEISKYLQENLPQIIFNILIPLINELNEINRQYDLWFRKYNKT